MISKSEKKQFLNAFPRFDDITCSLRAIGSQPSATVKEVKEVVALARKFNKEVIRPHTLELDLKMTKEHDYLPLEFVKKANEWGLYTLFIPKIFGGQGYQLAANGYFLEELASGCLAMANLVGVHYLGFIMVSSSWNIRVMNKVLREVVEGERNGAPCLLTLAMTEPNGGTDSQNTEFMDTGNLGCHAKKVEGGYIINGTKIFISCGHLSTWHFVHSYTDLDRASKNTVMLAVKTGTKGFSFGKTENKMGQKGSVASELIFNDCFVPDENVCIDNQQAMNLKRRVKQTNEQIFANIWGLSRVGVGYFGAGAARGAFEEALRFASEHKINEELIVNHEWCQSMLAQMYLNAAVARTACFDGMMANSMHGLMKAMSAKPAYYLTKYAPAPILTKIYGWLSEKKITTWLFRKIGFDLQRDQEIDIIDGWGSLAKIAGTDAGIKNCHMALEIMGQQGLRHDQRAEKILRDSKLLQIYEGTNQVNRINLFKRLISKSNNEIKVFSTSNI